LIGCIAEPIPWRDYRGQRDTGTISRARCFSWLIDRKRRACPARSAASGRAAGVSPPQSRVCRKIDQGEGQMTQYVRLLGAAAAIALLSSLPAMAQSMRFRYETPEQNNAWSARYDNLLETSPSFRAYRMRKECNPINFEQDLRQDCFASFDKFEPVR
jgi:hypothetical protein